MKSFLRQNPGRLWHPRIACGESSGGLGLVAAIREPLNTLLIVAIVSSTFGLQISAFGFEGRINAITTRGDKIEQLLYTVGTNSLRVENTAPNQPNPVDILDRNSGSLTLLFAHNHRFVRLKPRPEDSSVPPALPPMPAAGGVPSMPTMAAMPMMGKMELQPTGLKTNLLGFACEKFEIKQHGELMEIWATDQWLPFQVYVRNQPPPAGPHVIVEQWAELLKVKKLFPLLATLKADTGLEEMRFEVKSVIPQKLTEADAPLFQPPSDYIEIRPLPF